MARRAGQPRRLPACKCVCACVPPKLTRTQIRGRCRSLGRLHMSCMKRNRSGKLPCFRGFSVGSVLADGKWQRKNEPRPPTFVALHPDAPGVSLDDAARDGEAEAGAVRGRAVLALEVAIEDARQVPRRNARAVV